MTTNPRKKYDSTVARIAGNILSGLVNHSDVMAQSSLEAVVVTAVRLARAVVAEVERTTPVIRPCGQEWTFGGDTFVCVLELNHRGACEHA